MGLKDFLRKGELDLIPDEAYDHIALELKNGVRDEGMWIKALAITDGNEGKAISEYINLRFSRLLEEQRKSNEQARQIEQKKLQTAQAKNRLISSLPKTSPPQNVLGSLAAFRYWIEQQNSKLKKLSEAEMTFILEWYRSKK